MVVSGIFAIFVFCRLVVSSIVHKTSLNTQGNADEGILAKATYYPNVLIDLSVTSELGAQVNKTYGTSFENPQWIGYILTGALLDNKTDASMKVSQTKRRGSICRES